MNVVLIENHARQHLRRVSKHGSSRFIARRFDTKKT
jgi:hypothetical protein